MAEFADQPATTAGGGISNRMNDSDWMCTDIACGNINFARRTTCNRCNKERADLKFMSKKKLTTEIGKSAADKSRGLFSADDWQCNKCANVNWARRQTCNVCNAPKFGEVEARTGYGGGYNERGTVEYRPRRDSDEDEYDEFGRRKKRKGRDRDRTVAPTSDKVGVPGDIGRKRSVSENSNMPTDATACRTLNWIRHLAKEGDSRPDDGSGPDSEEGGRRPLCPESGPLVRPDLRSNVKTAHRPDAVPKLPEDVGLRAISGLRSSVHPSGTSAVHSHANTELMTLAEPDVRICSRTRREFRNGGEEGQDIYFDPIKEVHEDIKKRRLSPNERSRGRLNGVYVEPRRPFFRKECREMIVGPRLKNDTLPRDRLPSGERLTDSKRGRDSADSSAPFPPVERLVRAAALHNRKHIGYGNPSFERAQFIALDKNSRRRDDCIMENRVSSTNEIRYRFEGGTADKSFRVTYNLEEQVWAAACAIVYRSCKASSDMFQSAYDKPAPDFNTIFAWRQRLLTTGCLVDSHVTKKEIPIQANTQERIGKRRWPRKKRFYMHNNDSSDTSDNECDRVISRPKKVIRKTGNAPADQFVVIDSPESDVNNKNVLSQGKYGSIQDDVDNLSSYRSGGSRPARNSRTDNSKSVDHRTDGTRSITPELMATRMDLARFDFPTGPPPLGTAFHDDVCFEVHAAEKTPQVVREPEKPDRFIVPQVPKLTLKPGRTTNDFDESLTKGYLEDIVSESELHSSDAGQSDYESLLGHNNDASERNPNSDHKSPATVSSAPASNDASNDNLPETYKAGTVVEMTDKNYYSPSKVVQSPKVNVENENSPSNVRNEEQGAGAKNFSSAIRRIYERMSTEDKEKSGEMESVLEYIPTKIDPAMAKRNYRLFNSDSVTVENIHDIWPNNVTNEILCDEPSIVKESDPIKSKNVTSFFTDYLPDEDALYRDASNDVLSDSLKTPPDVSVTKLTSQSPMHKETQENVEVAHNRAGTVADGINALVNFNFASVNAEQLALALKNIQNMLVSKDILERKMFDAEKNTQVINGEANKTPAESQLTQSPEPENNNDNIPFLDDMFCPGSPVTGGKETENLVIDNIVPRNCISSAADLNLDDILECSAQAKKVSISGFQSFAIPKPIMLNRLKSLSKLKEAGNEDSKKKIEVKKKKKIKRVKSNEEDRNESDLADEEDEEEESGDDEDLSKYDLCGSEDDNDDDRPKKSDTDINVESSSAGDKNASEKNDSQRRDKSRSPARNQGGDRPRKRSDSGSSSSRRSSSSSSSSSASSSGRLPKNRYDDFNLNSEHSRAGSREDSPNARSRSPIYPAAVDASRSRSTNDKRRISRSRSRDNNKTKSRISSQDGVTRDKGRSRESNRDRDNRDRAKGGRDSRDSRRPYHNQNQNHSQNARYHHPRGRGRGGSQMRRMW